MDSRLFQLQAFILLFLPLYLVKIQTSYNQNNFLICSLKKDKLGRFITPKIVFKLKNKLFVYRSKSANERLMWIQCLSNTQLIMYTFKHEKPTFLLTARKPNDPGYVFLCTSVVIQHGSELCRAYVSRWQSKAEVRWTSAANANYYIKHPNNAKCIIS